MTKRLYLLRHAKAAPDDGGGDHERPLTARGRRDAPDIAREFVSRGFTPGLMLCSTSRRTTETLDLARPFLSQETPVLLERGLFHASDDHLLARAGRTDPGVGSILFVGHNPGLEELALRLAGDSAIGRRIAQKFPTSAFAAFESLAGTWPDAVRGQWTALAFLIPADL
jgi:phosphohistidine phosphatase